ncbi:MAG: TolC family protein [Cyanobacteria bacterium]|nr:TolC family protein [Cyanobacteriota bacterium]
MLDLRAKSLEVAATQLTINKDLLTAGLGTSFEVMQAKTLYSLEKQRLVRQEVGLRQAALQLAVTLNKSMIVGLVPSEAEITRHALIEPTQTPEALTALAIENRPELARLEQLRLAARNASVAAASPLLPRAAFFTNNSINIGGSGSSIIIPTGGGSASGGITDSTGGGSANSSFAGGFILNWLVAGAGLSDAGNALATRMQARRALLEGKEELLKICAEVRSAYLDTRAADTEIDVTSDAVEAATEQLRMANVRLTHQIGTNLEVIQAERDYIDAVSRRIDAFVNYKKSQARLLHATGMISVESLTAEQPQRFQLRRGK